jgi:hypothetical protein
MMGWQTPLPPELIARGPWVGNRKAAESGAVIDAFEPRSLKEGLPKAYNVVKPMLMIFLLARSATESAKCIYHQKEKTFRG